MKTAKSVTADGKHFDVLLNIGTPKDLDGVLANGAEGIGLYRTESLYMDLLELPTEDDVFEAYKKVFETMNPKPVVVATMDIGGDKHCCYRCLPQEQNPSLGYRLIRMCLDRVDISRTVRWLLCWLSLFGNLRIMSPMMLTMLESKQAKQIFTEEKEKLV